MSVSTRNAPMVHIINLIRLKWCIHFSRSLYLNIIYMAAAERVIWLPPEVLSECHEKRKVKCIWRPTLEKSYLGAARRENLSGGPRKVIWRPLEEKSYLTTARRKGLSGGSQKSYKGQSKITESCLLQVYEIFSLTQYKLRVNSLTWFHITYNGTVTPFRATSNYVLRSLCDTINGISAIECDSGGCKLVMSLSFDWLNFWVNRQIDFIFRNFLTHVLETCYNSHENWKWFLILKNQ